MGWGPYLGLLGVEDLVFGAELGEFGLGSAGALRSGGGGFAGFRCSSGWVGVCRVWGVG